jgi:hypothetical protein
VVVAEEKTLERDVGHTDKAKLPGEGKYHAELSGERSLGPELDPEVAVHEMPGAGTVPEAEVTAGLGDMPGNGPTAPEADGVLVAEMDADWRGWEVP